MNSKLRLFQDYRIAVVPYCNGKADTEWLYLSLDDLSDLPEIVGEAVFAIIDHKGAEDDAAVMAWEAGEEERPVSKY